MRPGGNKIRVSGRAQEDGPLLGREEVEEDGEEEEEEEEEETLEEEDEDEAEEEEDEDEVEAFGVLKPAPRLRHPRNLGPLGC